MVGETTFGQSLRIQIRVLNALLLREIITRYGRANLGVLWLFLEPVLYTVGVLAIWALSGVGKGHVPIAAFCLTGYSSLILWRNCANRASGAINPNLGLLYHGNVRILDLMLSRIVLEIGGATASFVGLTVFFVSISLADWPVDIVGVVFGWLLLAWFAGSLAIVIASATVFSNLVERFWHPTAYLLFPLSGALFMVDWLPPASREYILYLPMVSALEILREGYFGDLVKAHYDLDYLVIYCLIQTLFGLALVRHATRRVVLLS